MIHINLIEAPFDAAVTVMDRATLTGRPDLATATGHIIELQLTDDLILCLDQWQAREIANTLSLALGDYDAPPADDDRGEDWKNGRGGNAE